MATASIFTFRSRRTLYQNSSRASLPLPSPTKTTAPLTTFQDNRQIVILADIDLINGDLLQFLEIYFAIFAVQVSLLDTLDDIPNQGKVSGDIGCGHMFGKLENISSEIPGVCETRISKADISLPNCSAIFAFHSGNFRSNVCCFLGCQSVENKTIGEASLDELLACPCTPNIEGHIPFAIR